MIVASFPDSVVSFRGKLIERLVTEGARVYVCAPFVGSTAASDAVMELGALPINISTPRTGMNPFADLVYLVSLITVLWRIRPSVVLAYTAKPVIYGMLAAALLRVPRRFALITGLGYGFQVQGTRSIVSLVVRRLYRLAVRRSTLTLFQNPDDECHFREVGILGPESAAVVVSGSGVDIGQFTPAPVPPGPVRFLMIGRLLGNKGVREFVGAARIVRSETPEVRFRLVGWIDDGPDAISHSELSSWIAEGVIEFLGRMEDVRPAIADCSVYVLPSYREGTPRTVLEAMAMARAVITTDAPGCRETVVAGRNGYLVAPRSVGELVDALRIFVNDPTKAAEMGKESRRVAEHKYDVDLVNDDMLSAMGFL